MKNAFTYQRVVAYLIDIIIVGIITSLLTFWIPQSEKYESAIKEEEEYFELYTDKKIEINEYVDKVYETRYILEKETVFSSIVSIVITFAYFATFQYYNGQTLGKKLMHIKVVSSDEKELTHLQLAIRALIINECFFGIVSTIMIFLINSNQYLYTIGLVEFIQVIVVFISFLMVVARKDKKGLHDILCKTEVVLC